MIADDHDLLRDVFDAWFRKEGIEVIAAQDLDAALGCVAGADPFDLILLDYRMPGMDGLNGLARMLAVAGGAPVALMSGNAPRDVVQAALDLGAAGFLPKTLAAKSLVHAVRFMAGGERFVPAEFGNDARAAEPSVAGSGSLTARERQVLEKLCEGKGDADIARDLGLGEPTVRLHVKTLCRKIGASSPAHATEVARQAGLC
jgi:DNA-binding NarL/FixJ family response regulator